MRGAIAICAVWALVAFAKPAPEPVITAAAVLPRAIRTFGWHSTGMSRDTTLWRAFEYDDQENPIGTFDNYWADWCADESTWCDIPTSCGGGSLYFSDAASRTPQACDGREYKCNTDYLFESLEAETPTLTKVGCVISTWTARSYYITSPEAALATSLTESSRPPPTGQPSPTSSEPASSTLAPPSTSPTDEPSEDAKSNATNTGVIAGSVVGGVVGLAAIGLAALYIVRRTRNNKATAVEAPTNPAPLEYDGYGYSEVGKGDRYAHEADPDYASTTPNEPVEVEAPLPNSVISELPAADPRH